MKWQEHLANSISGLAVATIAAVIIHYLLPPSKQPKEQMFYSIEPPLLFSFSNTPLSVSSVLLTNQGAKPATNIRGDIVFQNAQIRDKAISSLSGVDHELKTLAESSNTYSFSIARLLPTDALKLSFAVNPGASEPTVTIRSDATTAMNATTKKEESHTIAALIVNVIMVLAVVVAVAFLVLRFYFPRKSQAANSRP
jgi:hypothetical protein